MTKTHTKKGEVEPLILEALKEYRTVPEVLRFIRKKYGEEKEPSPRTVYHHINKIKEESNEKNSKYKFDNIGKKYRIIEKVNNESVSDEKLFWFIESYNNALDKKDQMNLFWLRKDLSRMCFNKITNEKFLDFLIDLAKKDSYEYYENLSLDMGNTTFTSWECLKTLSRYDDSIINKKLGLLYDFFADIITDQSRKYAEERIEAYHTLITISYMTYGIKPIARLLLSINPKNKVKFSPNKFLKVNEFELFRNRFYFTFEHYAIEYPFLVKRLLYYILQMRKDKFGEKDEGVKLILDIAERIRSPGFEAQSEKIKEHEKKMKKWLKDPEFRKEVFPWEDE